MKRYNAKNKNLIRIIAISITSLMLAYSGISHAQDTDSDGVNDALDCAPADASIAVPHTYYFDLDGDQYGDANNSFTLCSTTPFPGSVVWGNDPNDTDNSIVPVVVPAGERVLALDFLDTAADGRWRVDRARELGANSSTLSLDWSLIETAPSDYSGPQIGLIGLYDAAYASEEFSILLEINPVSRHALNLPADLANALESGKLRFNDAQLISRFQALLTYVHEQLGQVQLDGLVIGRDVDLYAAARGSTTFWADYGEFLQAAKSHARTLWGVQVQVGVGATHAGLVTSAATELATLNASADMVAVNYEPRTADFSVINPEQVSNDFAQLMSAYPNKPVHFTRVSFPSAVVLGGSQTLQSQFLYAFFEAWDQYASQIPYVAFTQLHDMSQAAASGIAQSDDYLQSTGVDVERITAYLASTGTRNYAGSGQAKSAYHSLRNLAFERGWWNAKPRTTRNYLMGLTPYPYDHNPGGDLIDSVLDDVFSDVAQAADMVSFHFDKGVPWNEAAADQFADSVLPYSNNLTTVWDQYRSRQPSTTVSVAVNPLGIPRTNLAAYWGMGEGYYLDDNFDPVGTGVVQDYEDRLLVAPWSNYALDAPEVKTAYLNYIRRVIEYFDPRYLVMGLEVNLALEEPLVFAEYVELQQYVYEQLRLNSAYDDIKIVVSFAAEFLIEDEFGTPVLIDGIQDPTLKQQHLDAIAALEPFTDIIGLSVYPVKTRYGAYQLPASMFDQLFETLATVTSKPLAITETGYPSTSFVSDGWGLPFDSNAEKQERFTRLLLEEVAQHGNVAFVNGFSTRDLTPYMDKLRAASVDEPPFISPALVDFFQIFEFNGLFDLLGNPLPAAQVWLAQLATDFTPLPSVHDPVALSSPDGNLTAEFRIDDSGQLIHELRVASTTVLSESRLGVTVDGVNLGSGVVDLSATASQYFESSYPIRGSKSVADNRYNETIITLDREGAGDAQLQIEVRMFDSGLAYRYRIPGIGTRTVSGEQSTWVLPESSTVWHQINTGNYEAAYNSAVLGSFADNIGGPITIQLPNDGPFLVLAEAGNRRYSGLTYTSALASNQFTASFLDDVSWSVAADDFSPWRVTMLGETLDTLIGSEIIYNLNDAPDETLFPNDVYTGWIKPGRAVWSWWSDFNSGYSFDTQIAYVDYAQQLGFEYSVVDAWWEIGFPDGGMDQFERLSALVDYAQSDGRNVGIWVWKNWFELVTPQDRADFFQAVSDAGVVGVKIDNVAAEDSESQASITLYEDILRDAATFQLMVNFHGAAKPTGLARTYPNEITREGFMGLELNGLAWEFELFVPPEHNATIPFSRFLLGPGDYTPVTFDERKLGDTTFSHQLALAGLYTSPLQHIADNPSLILAQTDVLDVLKDLPTTWDETIAIEQSRVGELAGLARRSGKRWYLFVINGDAMAGKHLSAIDLSFLGDGEFDATLISDATATSFNREEMSAVTASDSVSASLLPGGGFVARFTPALPVSRTTRLGFATIPVSDTDPGWQATYAAIRDSGDMVTHSLQDGIPWPEALNSSNPEDYSPLLQSRWDQLRVANEAVIPGHAKYLMINPIATDYLGLAPYYGEFTNMALPPPWDQYAFDHPDVKTAALNFMIAAVEYFDPTYLAINVEANILLAKQPTQWNAFKDLNAYLYQELKQRYPDIKIFSTIHYEHMLGLHSESAELQAMFPDILEYEVRQLLINSDVLALSTYPYMVFNNPLTVGGLPNEDYFDVAYTIASDMQLPLAIDQTGYISRDFYHEPTTAQLYGSEIEQQKYLRFLLEESVEHNYMFINYFVPVDYGTNFGTHPTTLTWAYAGLYNEDGSPKRAVADWNSYLALPYQAVVTGTRFSGNVLATTIGSDRVDLTLENGFVARVEVLDEDIARVRINANGLFTTWKSGAISWDGEGQPGTQITDFGDSVVMSTEQLVVTIEKSPFKVTGRRSDGTIITDDLNDGIGYNPDTGVIFNRKSAPPDEVYLGLGLRGGPLNRRGDVFVQRNTDNFGYGEFTSPLYSSTPYFLTQKNAEFSGIFVDSPAQPFFDMDSNADNTLLIGAYQQELDYYVFAGPDVGQVVDAYARITGYIPLPPKWALGFHQSRYGYNSWEQIQTVGQTFRDLQIPVDAIYLDLDYMNDLDWFSWDPVDFPAPLANNAQLEALGIKRVNILDPSIQPDDPLYDFLVQSHYFLEDAATGEPVLNSIFLPFGDVSWFDYTRDDAGEFYMQRLKTFLDTGVSGIWNDINEPASNFMPQAIYDFNGQKRTDLEARNLYALANVQWTQQAMLEHRPNERPFILSRSGYSGSQRYNANWSGDSLSTFDSLRVSIQNSLHMSMSGMIQFGHDIGGFLGTPDAELFTRWMQFASFNPFFRNHAVNTSEFSEPWVYGEPYTSVVRSAIEQRYLMFPHLYSMVERASRTAEPVLAPSYYHFPNDPLAYEQDTEFMFGRHMLVAPVYESAVNTRSLYLPAGASWYDMQSGQQYEGGQTITVPSPLDVIPTFAREGAILMGGPLKQYVDDPVPPLVTVDLYPGDNKGFTLYEDDGISFEFRNGSFRKTPLSQNREPGFRQVNVGPAEGARIAPISRPWMFYFHAMSEPPLAVKKNGVNLSEASSEAELDTLADGWFYRAADSVLVVKRTEQNTAVVISVEEAVVRSKPTKRGWRDRCEECLPGVVR